MQKLYTIVLLIVSVLMEITFEAAMMENLLEVQVSPFWDK
jgi:hypothetical protein